MEPRQGRSGGAAERRRRTSRRRLSLFATRSPSDNTINKQRRGDLWPRPQIQQVCAADAAGWFSSGVEEVGGGRYPAVLGEVLRRLQPFDTVEPQTSWIVTPNNPWMEGNK